MAQLAAQPERVETAEVAAANPAPLGLSAFALTTFVLSCINAGFLTPQGVGTEVVIGLALFYGGLGQILAGMWEFRGGNTLGGTAFTSYGGFWLAFAVIVLPGTGVMAALTKAGAVGPTLGVFALGWAIFTGMMALSALRTNLALIAVFVLLFLTYLALAIGYFGAGTSFIIIGGWLGILTALAAWYTALAGVLNGSRSLFTLPTWPRA